MAARAALNWAPCSAGRAAASARRHRGGCCASLAQLHALVEQYRRMQRRQGRAPTRQRRRRAPAGGRAACVSLLNALGAQTPVGLPPAPATALAVAARAVASVIQIGARLGSWLLPELIAVQHLLWYAVRGACTACDPDGKIHSPLS